MKMIMTSYPGFQDLPKGVRKMLLVSESFFFDEMRRRGTGQARGAATSPVSSNADAETPLRVSWHVPGARVIPTRSAFSQA